MIDSTVYNWIKNNLRSYCLLCGLPTRQRELSLCNGCLTDLPWLQAHCRQCALPLPQADSLCGKCLNNPPPFLYATAPLAYRFPVDSLIPAFKYHRQSAYGRLLSQVMRLSLSDYLGHHPERRPDLLVAMPMHPGRQAQRGYNHAFELARPLARALGLELAHNALQRSRATQPQQGLSASERRHNLHDAFHCPCPERVASQHIALVDDVMTTGVSAAEASRTLLRAGAASVQIWCAARTP
ncbi:MAG: double zinc ribbon domain-containing protein [Halopseudomonas sp.]|uniref:ComF family protein n=1 Tax=Halopseudomonas sp. TaxID=2901191 RepID=UPI0030036E12